jgi:hypothetical protein
MGAERKSHVYLHKRLYEVHPGSRQLIMHQNIAKKTNIIHEQTNIIHTRHVNLSLTKSKT